MKKIYALAKYTYDHYVWEEVICVSTNRTKLVGKYKKIVTEGTWEGRYKLYEGTRPDSRSQEDHYAIVEIEKI